MMDLHGKLVDIRLQGARSIGQRRQFERSFGSQQVFILFACGKQPGRIRKCCYACQSCQFYEFSLIHNEHIIITNLLFPA